VQLTTGVRAVDLASVLEKTKTLNTPIILEFQAEGIKD
jgi:hypothetical protein